MQILDVPRARLPERGPIAAACSQPRGPPAGPRPAAHSRSGALLLIPREGGAARCTRGTTARPRGRVACPRA
eukprot:6416704-Prymnesium_polylepis.1